MSRFATDALSLDLRAGARVTQRGYEGLPSRGKASDVRKAATLALP
jgi:hypothetical protein